MIAKNWNVIQKFQVRSLAQDVFALVLSGYLCLYLRVYVRIYVCVRDGS